MAGSASPLKLRLARAGIALVCLLAWACSEAPPKPVRDPSRVILSYDWHGALASSDFNEPSGIVYDRRRGTLFVVGDEGDVGEMTTDGKLLRQSRLRAGADFEGLTQVPATGLLYIAVEGEEKILEVDPEDFRILREFALPRSWKGVELLKPGGQGLEGICFVPDAHHAQGGTFFVANQSFSLDPDDDKSVLVQVELPLRPDANFDEPRILHWFSLGVIDMSALHYEADSGHILVVSDSANALLRVTPGGEVVQVLALTGDNQEGLTIDDEGFMYIAQDSGGVIKTMPHWP